MSPRYRPLTNAERGLKTVMQERNLDYDLLVRLHKAGLADTAIAKALSNDRAIKLHPKTIKGYRSIYEAEQASV